MLGYRPKELAITDAAVDENLGNFFSCLSNDQRMGWLANELFNRHVLEIKLLSDMTLKQLARRDCNPQTQLVEEEGYDILLNIFYQRKFGYVPIGQRMSQELILEEDLTDDSDCIRILLNMRHTIAKGDKKKQCTV